MTDGRTEGQHLPPQIPNERGDVPPRVMLLGGGEAGRELAVALRRLGASVVAVDERADAPAHGVADQSLVVAMADGLSEAIRRVQPDFVVTATDGIAVGALDELAASGEQRLVPSARAVRLTGDREGLRRLAADELGLPTAPFWFVKSVEELRSIGAHAGFPLLVQPADRAAGRGRRSIVAGPDEIEAAWQRAGSDRVLAETVVEVEFLVTLLVVSTDGAGGPVIDFCSPIGHRGAEADVPESWQPQKLTPAAMDSARSIAARIVKALGGRGVFGIELMINGDEVYFADVSARLRGSAWVTACSQRLSVFDLQARAILGLPVDTVMVSPGAACAVLRGPDGGRPQLAGALRIPESDVRLFARERAGKTGVALATAPEVAEARDRARQVAAALAGRDSPG